jgi:hypothetical protein
VTEFPMSNDTYHRLIDASSDCSDTRNARAVTPQGTGLLGRLTSLIGRKPR